MAEIVGQNLIRRPPEAPRPKEKLSDEEMGNLLSAVGNHEAKAITLILMRNGNIYDMKDLHRAFLNAQGENKGWRMDKHGPFDYCRNSLAPIGLVAMEIINPDLSTYGYAITENGKELGIPLVGLLLDFSERYDIPLNLLFGITKSSSKSKTIQAKEGKDIEFKKRSPSTTLQILYELLSSPSLPIRTTDLEEGIGKENLTNTHRYLTRLARLGLIGYKAREVNKPYSFYRLTAVIPEGELPIYKHYSTLTKSVFDVLRNYPDQYLTSGDIYNLLPKEQKERKKNKQGARNLISDVLFFLAQHKYADIGNFTHEKASEINLTDGQRVTLTELLVIIDRFQNQDPEILEEGRKLAGEIISDPNKISNLLKRVRESSTHSPTEETQEMILSIILSNPNGVTNKEIQKLLEEEYDKRLIASTISVLSSSLTKNEAIRVEKEGRVNRFYPNKT